MEHNQENRPNPAPNESEGFEGRPDTTSGSYSSFQPLHEEPPAKLKHSGPGIASFVLSLVGFMLGIIMFVLMIGVFAGNQELLERIAADPNAIQNEPELLAQIAVFGVGWLAGGVCMLIGLVLGIIGLVQKQRKKVFAVLGTIFNGLIVAGFILLMLIGLAINAAA